LASGFLAGQEGLQKIRVERTQTKNTPSYVLSRSNVARRISAEFGINFMSKAYPGAGPPRYRFFCAEV